LKLNHEPFHVFGDQAATEYADLFQLTLGPTAGIGTIEDIAELYGRTVQQFKSDLNEYFYPVDPHGVESGKIVAPPASLLIIESKGPLYIFTIHAPKELSESERKRLPKDVLQ
jgi:hypothetical protein